MRIVYQTLSSLLFVMPLNPDLASFLELVQAGDSQPMHLQTPAAARASYDAATSMLDAPGAASVATQDLSLPCADGHHIGARLYSPPSMDSLPCLLSSMVAASASAALTRTMRYAVIWQSARPAKCSQSITGWRRNINSPLRTMTPAMPGNGYAGTPPATGLTPDVWPLAATVPVARWPPRSASP